MGEILIRSAGNCLAIIGIVSVYVGQSFGLTQLERNTGDLGSDISGGKKGRSKIIFSNLTKVRALNKTVEILCLQHYSF